MRANLRIKIGGITLFGMFSQTQTLEGVTSLLPNGLHTPFFDIENCSLNEAENTLSELQFKYRLSNIFITSDKDRSFRAWCFSQIKYTDFLRMQLDLIDAELLDYNFFWWTVKQSKATLRVSNKTNRPPQELVSVLNSYSVPIPKSVEKVIYDTGIQKRGFTVFLGEGGKIISGDRNA
jgi:hypothetical protein